MGLLLELIVAIGVQKIARLVNCFCFMRIYAYWEDTWAVNNFHECLVCGVSDGVGKSFDS